MKATLLTPNRLLLEFPTRKEMTLSCFRISEFKEGKPEIKGRYFTADEFIDAYSDEKGDLDYFSYWEGFNFSKKELFDFAEEFTLSSSIPPVFMTSEREEKIISFAKGLTDNSYIICMVEGDEMTLKHETAHALFFENEEYRKSITSAILNDLGGDVIDKYRKHLVGEMDYNEEVLIDEIHAYLVAFDQDEHDECFPSITEDDIYSIRPNLQGLFNKFNK